MRTIAVTNSKGGSAKTTTTVNLAAALGELGYRVLVIDMDPQGSTSSWLGVEGEIDGVAEAIEGRRSLGELIYETTAPGVVLVAASPTLVASDPQEETRIALGFMRAMDHLPELWDVVLVDSPPSLGYLAIAPLSVCSEVLIPVEAHILAIAGLGAMVETMARIRRRLNPSLRLAGVLACRVRRTSHSRDMVARLQEQFGESFMKTMIRDSVRLAEAPSFHLPITLHASRSAGAEDFRAAAREVMTGWPAPRTRPSMTVAVEVGPDLAAGNAPGNAPGRSRLGRIVAAVTGERSETDPIEGPDS